MPAALPYFEMPKMPGVLISASLIDCSRRLPRRRRRVYRFTASAGRDEMR